MQTSNDLFERNRQLDGLRGVAAFIVLISHFVQLYLPYILSGGEERRHFFIEDTLINPPFSLFYAGNSAVYVFFILSGFVLMLSCFRWCDPIWTSWGKIICKRYFRLTMPILMVMLIIYFFLSFGLYVFEGIQEITQTKKGFLYETDKSLLEVIRFSFLDIYQKGADLTWNPVLWTIRTELIGSIFIFTFWFLIGKYSHSTFRIVLYIILLPILWIWNSQFFETRYMILFVLGMLMADFWQSRKAWFQINPWFVGLIVIVALYGLSVPYYMPEVGIHGWLYTLLPKQEAMLIFKILGSALLLYGFLSSVWLKKLFSRKVFGFLGDTSYMLYILHYSVLYCVGNRTVLWLTSQGMLYGWTLVIAFILSVLVVLLSAYLLHRYFEKPILKGLNRIFR